MNTNLNLRSVVAVVVISFTILCTDWNNPFLNSENSKATFANSSITNNTVVEIFSQDSLTVTLLLQEHLTSFNLRCKTNRFWTDTTITADKFVKPSFKFHISLYDTGNAVITLTSRKENGDSVSEQIAFYAENPLWQDDLTINPGSAFTLKTKAVKSSGVKYVWDFHNGLIKDSPFPEFDLSSDTTFSSAKGELYIKDGVHRSPSVFFNIISPSPVTDPDSAKALLKFFDIHNGNSIQIFSTESIGVAVHLREYISSYILHIDNNRYWSDTTVTPDKFSDSIMKFKFSLYDTGISQIVLTSFNGNGTSYTDKIIINALNPLNTGNIKVSPGDSISLTATKVKDTNVSYVWDFHNGYTFTSSNPNPTFFTDTFFSSIEGEFYVKDTQYRSPGIPFLIYSEMVEDTSEALDSSKAFFLEQDSGSVPIFSKKVINIGLVNPRFISHYTLYANGNRHWKDTLITSDQFTVAAMKFDVSYYDTGSQSIILTFYKTNGSSFSDSVSFRTSSPLKQDPVTINIGDTVRLSTFPVEDNVFYIWDFHDGSTVIKDFTPLTGFLASGAINSTIGELYVTDKINKSPSVFFQIIKGKTGPLTLTIINDSVQTDTIFATTPDFNLICKVSGASQLNNCSINETSFDQTATNDDGSLQFTKQFHNVDKLSPISARINVVDNFQRTVSDTFVIKYIESTVTDTPVITIQSPSSDSIVTSQQTIDISGTIQNVPSDFSGTIFFYLNDNLVDNSATVSLNTFTSPLQLDIGVNVIRCELYNGSILQGNPLATKRLSIYFDPLSVDSIPPIILFVKNGNILLEDTMIIRTSSMLIETRISDISSLAQVLINDTQATTSDSINYSRVISLTHPENSIIIKAIDMFNNLATDTIHYIVYNRLPVFTNIPEQSQIIADSTFEWLITAADPDTDNLTITATIGGTQHGVILIGSSGILQWKPSLADTGWHTITLNAFDGFENQDTTFVVHVAEPENNDVPVRWLTNRSNIPDSLIIGLDSIDLALKADPLSNLGPFHYKVVLSDINKTILDGEDSLLKWTPQITDIGVHPIKFTITDSKLNSDEFITFITIKAEMVQIEFERSSALNAESVSSPVVNVKLSSKARIPISVGFEIDANNTNASSADFSPSDTGTLQFQPGDSLLTIPVKIDDDSLAEADEFFTYRLRNPSANAELGVKTSFRYTILDNDYVTFSFSKKDSSGQEKVPSCSVRVVLSKPASNPITINCVLDSSQTTAGPTDYQFYYGSRIITFLPGEIEKYVRLNIYDDVITENDEMITLKLSTTSPLARPGNIISYKYTIIDNEQSVRISLTNANTDEDEYPHTFNSTVLRSGSNSETDITVYFKLNRELTTADSGIDFTLEPSPVVIPKSSWIAHIKTNIIDDSESEPDENVVFDIIEASAGVYVGSPSQMVITIKGNDNALPLEQKTVVNTAEIK